ncbi:MAG: hypothetical protein ACYTG7_23195, partial [Planctomycetota bacterium]|jgi:hypothetical protein
MTEGASAVKVHGGFLYTAGGEFHGGMAGAGDGGHGVHLVDGNPAYYHANDVHDGGVGFLPGVNGSPIKVDSGFEQAPSFAPNGFKASSPHRSNTKVTLSIDGAPDSTVILLFNFAPSSIFFQGYGGPLLMEPSNLLLWNLGTLPPAGTMTLNINVPPLTGFDSVGIYHQPVFLSDGSPPALGPGSFILYIGD